MDGHVLNKTPLGNTTLNRALDFIGLDVCLSILNVLYDGFKDEKYKPNTILEKMVDAGELGIKSKIGFYDYSLGIKEKTVNNRFL